MMNKFLLSAVFSLLLAWNLPAQTISTFENFNLPVDSFWNGSDTSGGFTDGNAFFANAYNSQWGSWSGFSYSTMRDTLTPGFGNMYSCISGSGYNQSATYAVANPSQFGGNNLSLRNAARGKTVAGFFINNNTYAYLSMRDGDAFSKKFGDSTGNAPDWFKLKISGYLNGNMTDTVDFYLADYRFSDNSLDYIVHEWTWLDLTSLGNVDSLVFEMSSSDVGQWGMNTPAFFCMDNFTTTDGVGFEEITKPLEAKVFPNPAHDQLQVSSDESIQEINIYTLHGQWIKTIHNSSTSQNIILNISDLNAGVYMMHLQGTNNSSVQKFIKQ